jgi:hypothetical protein
MLIAYINKLTDRGMPPTSQIVENLAEEIRGVRINKNWVSYFMKRYGDRLRSLSLYNMDNIRTSAECNVHCTNVSTRDRSLLLVGLGGIAGT